MKEKTCICGKKYPNCEYVALCHADGVGKPLSATHKVAHVHPGKPCKPVA